MMDATAIAPKVIYADSAPLQAKPKGKPTLAIVPSAQPLVGEVLTPLDMLASEINVKHAATCEGLWRTFEGWVANREQVKHGEWGPWIETNLSFNWSQTNKCMRVARHKEELLTFTGDMPTSLDESVALFARAAAERGAER